MKLLIQYLSVAGAGALGAMARLFVGSVSGMIFGPSFPVGTFLINISGSLLLGWFLAFAASRTTPISPTLHLAIAVGFVGAYTTFSTFMAESNSLLTTGQSTKAFSYLLTSLILGLLALRAGLWLGAR